MSVVQLPKYQINGRDAEEEATRLHFLKNRPDRPELEAGDFPPYHRYPFPTCIYRQPPGTELESRSVGVLDIDVEVVESRRPEGVHKAYRFHVNEQLRAQNERELKRWIDNGWTTDPAKVREATDRQNKTLAFAAAERAYDDRHLGEQARRELDAVEDAADDHVLDVPAPKKRPGRPKKTTEVPA